MAYFDIHKCIETILIQLAIMCLSNLVNNHSNYILWWIHHIGFSIDLVCWNCSSETTWWPVLSFRWTTGWSWLTLVIERVLLSRVNFWFYEIIWASRLVWLNGYLSNLGSVRFIWMFWSWADSCILLLIYKVRTDML